MPGMHWAPRRRGGDGAEGVGTAAESEDCRMTAPAGLWTPRLVAELECLWGEGLATAEIGKAHRIGLPARPSPLNGPTAPSQPASPLPIPPRPSKPFPTRPSL